MGDAFAGKGLTAAARSKYEEAIALGQDILPRASAVFRGALALLLAMEGEVEEALRLLEPVEEGVQIMQPDITIFLCRKGRVLLRDNQTLQARELLEQAKELARQGGTTRNPEVVTAIRALEEECAEGL